MAEFENICGVCLGVFCFVDRGRRGFLVVDRGRRTHPLRKTVEFSINLARDC